MRTDVREVLVEHGTAAAREHPAQVERGVRTGSRRLWRRLLLLNLLAGAAALILSLVLGGRAAELAVEDPPPRLTQMTVSAPDEMSPGGMQALQARGVYDDDSQTDLTTKASWLSSHPEVATVDQGVVTALSAGTTRITAERSGIPGHVVVTVRRAAPRLLAIGVIPGVLAVSTGSHLQFAALGVYSDGRSRYITRQVHWHTRDPRMAEIDERGLATALAPGMLEVTARLSGKTGLSSVEVLQARVHLTAITVEPRAILMAVDESRQLQATGTYSDDASRDLAGTVLWTTDAADIATVDSAGLVTAVSAGTATITATVDRLERAVEVTVVASPALRSITVTPPDIDLCPADRTVALRVQATYEDDSTADVTAQVVWTPRDGKVVTVDERGRATRTGAGSTTITATWAGKTDSVDVAACAAASPSVTSGTPSLPPTATSPGNGLRE